MLRSRICVSVFLQLPAVSLAMKCNIMKRLGCAIACERDTMSAPALPKRKRYDDDDDGEELRKLSSSTSKTQEPLLGN